MPGNSHKNIPTFKQICNRHSRIKKRGNALKHSRLPCSVHWSNFKLPSELLRASSGERNLVSPGSHFPESSTQVHPKCPFEKPVPGGSPVGDSMNDYFFGKEKCIREVLNLQPDNKSYLKVRKDILLTEDNGLPSKEPGKANHSNGKSHLDPFSQKSFLERTKAMFTETKQINKLNNSSIDPTAMKNLLRQSVTTTKDRKYKSTVEWHPCPMYVDETNKIELNHASQSNQEALRFQRRHRGVQRTDTIQNRHGSQDNDNCGFQGSSKQFLPNDMQTDSNRSQDFQKPVKESFRKQNTSSDQKSYTRGNKKRKQFTYSTKFRYSFEIFTNLLEKDYDDECNRFFTELLRKQLERIKLCDIKRKKKGSIENIIFLVHFIGQVRGNEVFDGISAGPDREKSFDIPREPQQNDNNSEDQDAPRNISMKTLKQNVDIREDEYNIKQEQIFECDQLPPELICGENELLISESDFHDADDLLNNIEIAADFQLDEDFDKNVLLLDGPIIQLPHDIDSYVPPTSDSIGINTCENPGEEHNELMNNISYKADEYSCCKTDMMNGNFTGESGESSYDKTNYFETLKTLNLCAEQALILDASAVVEPPHIKLEEMTISDELYLQAAADKQQSQRSCIELDRQKISATSVQTEAIDNVLLHDGPDSPAMIFNSLINTPEILARVQLPSVPGSAACQLPLQHFAANSDRSINVLDTSHEFLREFNKVTPEKMEGHDMNSFILQELNLQENSQSQSCSMGFISQVESDPLAMPQVDVSNQALLEQDLASTIMEIAPESVTVQGLQESSGETQVDRPLLSPPQVQDIKTEHEDYYYEAMETDCDTKPDVKEIGIIMPPNHEFRKSTRKKRVPDRLFYIGKGLQF